MLGSAGVSGEAFSAVCVIVDKMGKPPEEAMSAQLAEQGLDADAISTIRSTLGLQDLNALASALGDGSPAVFELASLFSLIDSYGISDWVAFDASVVRGLAYYKGPVFEAHDRAGELRAIVGGGRFDRLL